MELRVQRSELDKEIQRIYRAADLRLICITTDDDGFYTVRFEKVAPRVEVR